MEYASWEERYRRELEAALSARAAGKEGKARVCARRAAGAVIGEYLRRQGMPQGTTSAIDLLKILQRLPQVSLETREVAGYFLARVTPDYTLPIKVDLVEKAGWLANQLLNEA